VPIRYHADAQLAMHIAQESSYSTHPGPDAANCCRFLTFFVCQAIHRKGDRNIQRFTGELISKFISAEKARHGATATVKLFALLKSKPPSSKEACWNWKAKRIALEETIASRGYDYNGYPVSSRYFGSFCLDGLAMALWAVTHSKSLVDCILKVVNLCGDADTTASIAGQMAGAFYGYNSLQQDPFGKRMLSDIRRWDPLHEIELRALLLYKDGGPAALPSDEDDRRARECCCS